MARSTPSVSLMSDARSGILRLALIPAAMVLGGALALASYEAEPISPQSQDQSDDSRLPPGVGRALVIRSCSGCHDVTRAASVRLTREGWVAVVENMIARGARITDAEFPEVVDYLATNFAGEAPRPVNVNTAPAIDLESVLGLLRREAAAIVAYREANGPFKEIADLMKVSGLEYKKIEDKADRIVF